MAPNYSKLINKTNVLTVVAAASSIYYLSRNSHKKARPKRQLEQVNYLIKEEPSNQKPKAHVDRVFFRQLVTLLKIIVPGWASREMGLFVLVAASLVARTLSDLWMINNGTKVESAIVSMDPKLFQERLLKFFLAMPVISLVNCVLKWSIGELKIHLRTNLTHSLYEDYLKSFTYYRMSNLDNRIANADQLLTQDVDKFCECLADLYSNVAKPILDMGLYVYRLTVNLGGETPAIMMGYFMFSGVVLTYLRRPTGRLTMSEQKLEGEFRHINARLITNSEEIAFYKGNTRERITVLTSFQRLIDHLRKFLRFQVAIGFVDNIVAKYVATVVGFYAVSRPFVKRNNAISTFSENERFRLYYTYGRMMVKLGEAIGRLVLAGRELTRLAGFTARMTQLREVLKDLNSGRYHRTMVAGSENFVPGTGKLVFQDNVIRFDKVPLVTPNGDILIKELTFEVKSGTNVLVCGPNGCGKSSLFRVLGELWPIFGGVLTKPPGGKLFYIPQRPYMTLGSLRDQITYPHSAQEASRRGSTDEKLRGHLQRVQLTYLLDREGGLDAVADWLDVLSGGEKQRIAMARLFYHAPQFAILDECTSAVSVDVEGSMYQYCREVGITLFTVSHRRSLWKHHEHVLQFDGRGGYEFRAIGTEDDYFGS